jgi:hypothetical protein
MEWFDRVDIGLTEENVKTILTEISLMAETEDLA